MSHHPAKGGSNGKMAQVYQDYQAALSSERFQFSRLQEDLQNDLKNFPGLIKELLALDLELEMCGSWLWVHGQTFDYREKLKELGLRYSPNKRMWYFRPSGEESHSSKPVDMRWIRGKYGSDLVEAESNAKAEVLA
ncbi:MAG: hypothetical protein K0B37_10940 [Bacteroidales bacterium]|nr:hypothetical protein [Bacteroidales bacterium]